MSSSSSRSTARDNKSGFWKPGVSVPGKVSPRKEDRMKPAGSKRDAFQDFENQTSDAWDDSEDDLLKMGTVQMSLKDVQSSAHAVLVKHSKQVSAQNSSEHRHSGVAGHVGSDHHTGQGGHHGGPGVGIRLDNSWQFPKPTPLRYNHPVVSNREAAKLSKFKSLLAEPNIDLDDLRKISWSGIPKVMRPIAWKILAGYLPPAADRREATLERKRQEYFGFIDQYYDTRHQDQHQETLRQILKDIPRMTTLAHLMQHKIIQEIFERILYIWAIRHPASGYVQGINDLVTPFFVVFLSEFIDNDVESENCDLRELPKSTLDVIEADSFWCMTKLLDGIQDNYTFAQPGIQMKVNALRELIKRINAPMHAHIEKHHVEYLQFSFRWMNNLLMREIPLHCTIRLWDTYLSEVNGFADFHLYVCASFLDRFSQDILREKDFQGILMLLQNLPTYHWQNKEVEEILAEAYKLKYMFADAPNHLSHKS